MNLRKRSMDHWSCMKMAGDTGLPAMHQIPQPMEIFASVCPPEWQGHVPARQTLLAISFPSGNEPFVGVWTWTI